MYPAEDGFFYYVPSDFLIIVNEIYSEFLFYLEGIIERRCRNKDLIINLIVYEHGFLGTL
jgi:hypothetical protein